MGQITFKRWKDHCNQSNRHYFSNNKKHNVKVVYSQPPRRGKLPKTMKNIPPFVHQCHHNIQRGTTQIAGDSPLSTYWSRVLPAATVCPRWSHPAMRPFASSYKGNRQIENSDDCKGHNNLWLLVFVMAPL